MNRLQLMLWCGSAFSIAACAGTNASMPVLGVSHGEATVERAYRSRDVRTQAVTSLPTPAYINATPYANFVGANGSATAIPFAFNGASHVTVVASFKCKPSSVGGTIVELTNSWYLEGGTCDGGANPTNATGTHVYDASGVQALPASALSAGVSYLIAATQDGTTLTYYACAQTCTASSAADPHSLGSAAGGYIAASNGTQRIAQGDIWNVQLYDAALSQQQIAALAGAAPADPYPTSTPNSNAAYTDAKPVAQGGALGGTTVGPSYAADPFHIDWDMFCLNRPSHCSNGNPNYVGNDAAMVADTLPTSVYGAGISTMCASAVANTPGTSQCNTGVGVFYSATSDPLVAITCDGPYGCGTGPSGTSGNLNGSQIYIPSGALAQQGGDGHMSVRQPSGVICQLYFGSDAHAMKLTSTSVRVSAGACGPPNFSTEGSTLLLDGGYAANDEMSRGLLRPEDIVGTGGDGTDTGDAYAFYHALYGSFSNNQHGVVWPAVYGDGSCSASTTINGAMPYEGMYLYLDGAGFRAVENWSPPIYLRWLKRALGSIHRHGMIDMDSSNCTNTASRIYVNTLEWGSQSYARAGGASPLDAYLRNDIHPNDSAYVPAGPEQAISLTAASTAYTFDTLWYRDVPGLAPANFHWINTGCGQIAVQGSSNNPC